MTDPATPKAWTSRTDLWLGAGLLVHAFFLAALSGDVLRPFFNDASHTRRGFDFAVFYLAGQAFAEGSNIYAVEGAFGFRYLPAFALIVGRFLALFQPLTAYFLHLGITELFLTANLWLTWRLSDAPRRGPALFMWLAFSPYFLELYMGQVSFWAASLLFWLLTACQRGRDRWTGIYWAGAILIKPNALIILPAIVRLRALRMAIVGLGLVLLFSLPYFLFYPDGLDYFIHSNTRGAHVKGALTHAGNLGLQGALTSIVAKLADRPLVELSTLADLPTLGRVAIYVSQAAILLVALVASRRQPQHEPVPLLALWLCTFFLVYKDVWEHHYVFLLPVFVSLYLYSNHSKILIIFVFIALPTPFVFFDIQSGVYGAIDPERTWSIATSLCYRGSKLIPLAYLWFELCRQRLPNTAS